MKNLSADAVPEPIKAIVWDWNGTLLDDVHACIESINSLLGKRNLTLLNYNSYREIFGFPVRSYYELAGFDFASEPFDVVAVEFIDIYKIRLSACGLFPDVKPMLQKIRETGIPQFVLSAMEQDLLELSLKEKGIDTFFDYIAGTTDHYADGKLASARRLQDIMNLTPGQVLLIGDTIHDHEVASEFGWQHVLITRGHQSEPRLRKTGARVFEDFAGLEILLNGHAMFL